jgi:hypothetical protein
MDLANLEPDSAGYYYYSIGGLARYSCNKHPQTVIKGKVVFVVSDEFHFGTGRTYESRVHFNPTYEDALQALEESIRITGDEHHVFFEGLEHLKTVRGTFYYRLILGS